MHLSYSPFICCIHSLFKVETKAVLKVFVNNVCRSLKQDLEMVRSGQMDHKIKDLWEKMQA